MDYIGWAWLLVIVACVIIEALTMGLTTIWFGVGAFVAWLSNIVGLKLEIQILIFLLVSILSLILTRPIAIEKLKIGKTKTNADSLIGEKVKVVSIINNINNEGSVKVKGQMWSARSLKEDEIIEKDEIVYIKDIKGVRLIVEKINKN